jgi:hypothetical protein
VVENDSSAELFGWALNNAANWNTGGSSRWLSPVATPYVSPFTYPSYDPTTAGVYDWTTHFNLTGFTLAPLKLKGIVAADNLFEVLLNGNSIKQFSGVGVCVNASFKAGCETSFSVAGSSLLAGDNTLTFRVTNPPIAGNPTGLRTFMSLVPEPGTWALTAAGLLVLSLTARRRSTQRR